MSRPGVTYQDIAGAASQVKAEGRNVTIENVRAILGTGSIGTINVHLRKWKEAQNSTHKIASKEEIPEELVATLKGLWTKVVEHSSEKITIIEQNFQAEMNDAQQELHKYKTNNQRWQQLFNQWQQEKTKLSAEKLTLEQALEFNHKENNALNTKIDVLLQQLQDKNTRIEELHRLHKQTQENLEHYRESAREQRLLDQQQFDQQKQELLLEIKNLNEQSFMQREKFTVLQQQYQLLEQQSFNLEKQHSKIQEKFTDLKNEFNTVEKQKNEYQHANQHLQNQHQTAEKSLAEKTNQLVEAQINSQLLSQQLNESNRIIKELQDQNKLLSHEKWELAQEKSQLEGQLKQMHKMMA